VSQSIGPYGPFRLDARYTFSDFEHWGDGHNDGFAACIEACRGKRCVIDIGAHIGLVSMPAASVLADGGRVICFEPAGANRQLLRRHLELNGFAQCSTIEELLVGERDLDRVPFFEMATASGMNSIARGAVGDNYNQAERTQITLDTYCDRNRLEPEIVKIDVEGAELAVLRGGRHVLSRCRPQIFLSVHPRHIEALGETVDALAALIAELGYDCRSCDGRRVETFALREYILSPI
jgi:FkbM family methyltransferase